MNYYISVLKKYAVFNGRARRAEYWYFVLFTTLISFILGVVEAFGLVGPVVAFCENIFGVPGRGGMLANMYELIVVIPYVAVSIRRMHDVNKSGWFILVPIYNLVLAVKDGTDGKNKYGQDPKKAKDIV